MLKLLKRVSLKSDVCAKPLKSVFALLKSYQNSHGESPRYRRGEHTSEEVRSGPSILLRQTFGIAADAKVFFDDFLDGQWCGYKTPEMDLSEPVLHVMYEAPHRLTPGQLETGLDGENVIELSHVMDKSCQTGDVFLSASRQLAAAVITQLYAAMIQKGVCFGYLDTGEVKVFLRISQDPSRVEYFLTISSRDVEVEGDAEPRLHLTSVAQVFAFTILALQSPELLRVG
ncbi:hypothetical protein E4U25_001988 [Claviceps purpurea]|nr:hypothetical protein E4U25_001988 [Claviceps purpurea]